MYSLYARYALAPENSWKEIDRAESEEAALESMKHPNQELMDDTLLKIVSEDLVFAFGMIREGVGFCVRETNAFVCTSSQLSQQFSKYVYDWGAAWEESESACGMLQLAWCTNVDIKLRTQAALSTTEEAHRFFGPFKKDAESLIEGIRQWRVGKQHGSMVYRQAQDLKRKRNLFLNDSSDVAQKQISDAIDAIVCCAEGASGFEHYYRAPYYASFLAKDPKAEMKRLATLLRKEMSLADILRKAGKEILID